MAGQAVTFFQDNKNVFPVICVCELRATSQYNPCALCHILHFTVLSYQKLLMMFCQFAAGAYSTIWVANSVPI